MSGQSTDPTVYTRPLTLLINSVNSVISHPVILLPFATIAFVQLFILEILYFSVRSPFVIFFGPLIQRFFGQAYLHYPFNFVILPDLFQYFQVPIYILISSLFIAVAVMTIVQINNNRVVEWRDTIKMVWPQYVHLVVGAIMISLAYYLAQNLYAAFVAQIIKVKVLGSWFAPVKTVLAKGGMMGQILVGTAVTTAFAFLLPIIVIEKKKVFAALVSNFKNLPPAWWNIFIVIFIPSLLYVPILVFRSNVVRLIEKGFPEAVLIVLTFSCLMIMVIDAVIYTSITTYYLWRREHQ